MLSVIELHLGLVYFVCLVHDNCRCPFVFLRFKAGLFFNCFRALTSLRGRMFWGLIILIAASCVLTFPK